MTGAQTIQFLKGLVSVDTSRLAAGIKSGVSSLRQFSGAWKDTARAAAQVAKDVNTSINRIAIAATGMAVGAAKKFADFESTMARAGAVTRTLGTKDFARLEAEARRMGETTVFSAQQAAEAIATMGMAGFTTEEIIAALPGALELAAAGQVSIADAANVAAKTMRAFGAEATELGHINDVLVATFTRANTDITQLAEGMKHVAPVSKGLGVSLEDTAAALGKMADAGFIGSIGGTSLRNILSRLAGAVPEATAKLNEFGVVTLDSTGKMRPFLDILADIEKSAMKDSDILEIFGARGGPQLMALLEVGSQGLRNFSHELGAAGGIAGDIADAQLDTLTGQFWLLYSVMEGIAIEAGKSLSERFRGITKDVSDFLTEMKPDIVREFSNAIGSSVDAIRSGIKWARENADALREMAATFAGIIRTVGQFLAEHPRLLAALMALKIGGLLGVNAALVSTIRLFASFGSSAVRTVMILASTRAGFVGLALAGIAIAAKAVYDFTVKMMGLNAGMERYLANMDRLNQGALKKFAAVMREGSEIEDPNQRGGFFAAKIKETEKDLDTLKFLKENAESELKDMNSILDREAFKRKEAEIDRLKLAIEQAEQAKEDMGYELAAAKRSAAKARQQAQQAIADPSVAVPGMGVSAPGEMGAIGAAAPAVLTDNAANKQAEDEAAGQQAIRGALSGASPEVQTLIQMRDELIPSTFRALQQAFVRLGQDVSNGTITVDQFNEAISRVTVVRDAAMEIQQSLKDLMYAGDISFQQRQQFSAQLEQLNAKFVNGGITADTYQRELQKLNQTVDEAAAATNRENEAKRRAALLRGDFAGAGLNFQQALQDRLASFRMQQFNQQVDMAFRGMMGFNDGMRQVTNGFAELHSGMMDYGNQLGQQAVGSIQDAGQAFNQFFTAMSSREGQIASLQNNIALLEQNIRIFGDVLSQAQKAEFQTQIELLTQQLMELLNAPPVLNAPTGPDSVPTDPGLNPSQEEKGNGGSIIKMEFPNLTRMSQADVAQMVDAMDAEISRRGGYATFGRIG